MKYHPLIYTRDVDGWGVLHVPSNTVLANGLYKGEAAGFAIILNGDEKKGWACVGNKTAKRVQLLETIREKFSKLG